MCTDKYASFYISEYERCVYYFKIVKTQIEVKDLGEKSETQTVKTGKKDKNKPMDNYRIKLCFFDFRNGKKTEQPTREQKDLKIDREQPELLGILFLEN